MVALPPALRRAEELGAVDALLVWLPLALALGVAALLVYGAVQQDLRQSANDPQIELAENAAAALAAGAAPESVLPGDRVDLASNVAPFLIVYDRSGALRASSATLDDAIPTLPPGVLRGAQSEDRLTWQPAPGVRVAAVIVPYGGPQPGFVLAGRSLRLIEQREDALLRNVAAGLAAGLIVTLAAAVAVSAARRWLRRRFANS